MNRTTDLAARLANGKYEIDPKRVAEAMLRRRGRGLLMLVPATGEQASIGPDYAGPGPSLGAA
jgi:hypothetical protein